MSPALPLRLSGEVAAALAGGRGVVALESTILTHGMPWPENHAVAREAAAIIRETGAVPATVAISGGEIRGGLEAEEIEALARARDVRKISRADLAHCLVTGETGATTVAATMIAARLAGIGVFATGGIGGVHPGAAESFDISADLGELARSSVTVVCAGAKAILDLPKTFELLETLGVPVIVAGADRIPAFWSRDAGLPAPLRLDDPAAIAATHRLRTRLGIEGGQLVLNPVPEDDAIPNADIAPLIAQAEDEARQEGIRGKELTPFLLSRLRDLSDGRSQTSNRALLLANARLAARIARELALQG